MRFVTICHTACLLVAGGLGVLPGLARAQSRDLGTYVLFATDELRSRGLEVARGDVGVNDGNLFVRTGVMLDAPNSELSADRASIPTDARCARLIARSPGDSAPACPAVTTFSSPFADAHAVGAACGYPDPFPACSTDPTKNVEVLPGETRTLDPGSYGQVVVRSGGSSRSVLILRPGVYHICGLRTARGARIVFSGPTSLYVAGVVRFGSESIINSSEVDSHLIDLFTSGSVVRVARSAQATLRICAPFSTLRMGRGVQAFGRFVAQSIVAAGLQAALPTTTTTSTSSSTTSSTSTSSTTTTSTSSSSTTSTSSSSSSTTSTSSTSSSSTSTSSSSTTSTSSTSSSSTSSTTTSTSSTTTTSVGVFCGDGQKNQASEECDDGNDVDDDCCSNDCFSAADGIPCGSGDICSGDQTCLAGLCTPTSAAHALACLVPFSDAIITNFDDGTAATLALDGGTLGDAVSVGRGAWGVAVHPAGEEVWVTAREDDQVTILDAADRSVRATLTVGKLPLGIVFDPTGTRAYIASFGTDRVIVLDVASRTETSSIPVGNGPSGLAVDAAGSRLYVANFGSNNISVIDLASERVVKTIKTKKRPTELALDPVRARLYVTNFAANRISIVGTISDSTLATVRVGKRPFGVAVDSGRNRAYVTNAVSDTVSVIDGARCEVAAEIDVGDGPLGVGLDLPGTRALVANSNAASLSIIDTATDTVTATMAVGKTPVAFGGFIGTRANECPRSPLLCDDANPMTLDSCTTAAGCRFEPYPPLEAADVGLTELDTTVREAGVEALGGTSRAVLLSRLVVNAHTALVEGAGTPTQRAKRADRSVRRFGQVVKKGIRRHKMSCDVAVQILDLSRGVHVQLRLARQP